MSISNIMNVDKDKNWIETGKSNNITRFYVPDFQYTVLGLLILFRLVNDRDMKILITSSGKTTGTGKTTLAIILARWINKARNDLFDMNEEWSAKEYSFMDKYEYLQKYDEAKMGDPLITDELEVIADRRNFMYNEQKNFTHAWVLLRYKNVVTIGTAPGLMDLEKRLPEASDIWINVQYPGKANVYYLTVHDFEWTPLFNRLKMYGFREQILWNDISEDEDYKWLKEQKKDMGVPGINKEGQRIDESYVKDKVNQIKTENAKNLLKLLDKKDLIYKVNDQIRIENWTQSDLQEASGWSQQKISQLISNMEENGEILQ